MTSRALHIFGDILVISLIIIVFSTSCFFLIKRCLKDRSMIHNLTSSSTVVPVQAEETQIVVVGVPTQPTVPEILDV